jgi:hypothetical protein
MSKTRHIRLIGKRAAFNAEAWARAVEALARQLQREEAAKDSTDRSKESETAPEADS